MGFSKVTSARALMLVRRRPVLHLEPQPRPNDLSAFVCHEEIALRRRMAGEACGSKMRILIYMTFMGSGRKGSAEFRKMQGRTFPGGESFANSRPF